MSPEEKFIREWFKMPEDCKFEVEVVFIRPEQWMEAMKEYARRHAGEGFDAGYDKGHDQATASEWGERSNELTKPQYLTQTFGE